MYLLKHLRAGSFVLTLPLCTPRVEPHVIEHEHLQDRGLARAGGEDRQNIGSIKQLCHGLGLIIPRRVGPGVLKGFRYEFLSHPEENENVFLFASHVGSGRY